MNLDGVLHRSRAGFFFTRRQYQQILDIYCFTSLFLRFLRFDHLLVNILYENVDAKRICSFLCLQPN